MLGFAPLTRNLRRFNWIQNPINQPLRETALSPPGFRAFLFARSPSPLLQKTSPAVIILQNGNPVHISADELRRRVSQGKS